MKLISLFAVGFGCMKTAAITFTLILTVVGCKPADLKNAPRNIYNPPTKNGFTAAEVIDPQVRNSSIVVNPGNEHLVYHDSEGTHQYSYTPDPRLAEIVFKYMPIDPRTGEPRNYVEKIPLSVVKGDGYQRAFDFSTLIYTIGDLREKSFQAIQIATEKVDVSKIQIVEIYKQFPCFKFKNEEGKTRCKLTKDETTAEVAVYESSKRCSKLKKLSRKYDGLSVSDETAFSDAVTNCKKIEVTKKEIEKERKALSTIYKTGKDLANEMLNTAEEFTNEHFLATTATKFDPDTTSKLKSIIRFNEQNAENNFEINSVEEISLAIDFGLEAGGFELYSTENGRIKDFQLITTPAGNKRLLFVLINADYEISADLSVTSRPNLGVTIKGTFDAYFPALDKYRKGVMSFEFDFQGKELKF